MACQRFDRVDDAVLHSPSPLNLGCLGFGFTLKGESDFKLQKFLVGPPETFDTFYGVGGIDGDGDVFKTENIDEFQRYVLYCTRRQGVHIMMADGV